MDHIAQITHTSENALQRAHDKMDTNVRTKMHYKMHHHTAQRWKPYRQA